MYYQECVLPVEQRGSSSIEGTKELCLQLPSLFKSHNINSIFDARANDAEWQMQTLANFVDYHAGDRNSAMIEIAKKRFPTVDICVHDITRDQFPVVDLLFVRDVAIHMNNFYKRCFLQNWLSSGIPWLLMTQLNYCKLNEDFEQKENEWHFAEINWYIEPWAFPQCIDSVRDGNPQRSMDLWHRDQIKGLSCVQ